jgi:hypothetical protein
MVFMICSRLLIFGIFLSFFCSSATARLNESSGTCYKRYGKVIDEKHGLEGWVTYIFFQDSWRVTVTFFNDKAQRLLFQKTNRSMTSSEIEMILEKNLFQQGSDLKWQGKEASSRLHKIGHNGVVYEPGQKAGKQFHFPFGALEIYSDFYTKEVISPILADIETRPIIEAGISTEGF